MPEFIKLARDNLLYINISMIYSFLNKKIPKTKRFHKLLHSCQQKNV